MFLEIKNTKKQPNRELPLVNDSNENVGALHGDCPTLQVAQAAKKLLCYCHLHRPELTPNSHATGMSAAGCSVVMLPLTGVELWMDSSELCEEVVAHTAVVCATG